MSSCSSGMFLEVLELVVFQFTVQIASTDPETPCGFRPVSLAFLECAANKLFFALRYRERVLHRFVSCGLRLRGWAANPGWQVTNGYLLRPGKHHCVFNRRPQLSHITWPAVRQ